MITPNKVPAQSNPDVKDRRNTRNFREGNSTTHTPYKQTQSTIAKSTQNLGSNKRSHTPLLYRKPKLSSTKTGVKKASQQSTNFIVNENHRLKLHKASRSVTMKHLTNLCTQSTPEIRQIMQIFCLLLNSLKKPEYRLTTTFKNWNFLCEFIQKHSCTILAEVLAVANKIERGLYEGD